MALCIGILGGMGTYATIHIFEQYARIFPAEKEWDRPRIIIDNRCTMPSRVRAYLYGEKREELINQMTNSLELLLDAGCEKIILGCNTSHIFLPEIYEKSPRLVGKIENIIDNCVERIKEDGINEIFLVGSEGTIDSGIYQKTLEINNIKCISPQSSGYNKIRACIEVVKRGEELEKEKEHFLQLLNRFDACILGCTELPILYQKYKAEVKCKVVYDPIQITLEKIYMQNKNYNNVRKEAQEKWRKS